MLRSRLNDALKHSVKNKDKIAVSTLRLILAALKDRDIAHRTVDADDDGVGEPEILKLLQAMIKQRKDSIDAYLKGGRKDLADNEAEEIEVIKRFLPEQMSTKDVELQKISPSIQKIRPSKKKIVKKKEPPIQ